MENIENIMQATLSNLKNMISTDTVIGKSFRGPDDSLIIPISKVTVGFLAGGAEYSETVPKIRQDNYPYAGGGGAGMSVTPIAFLICNKDGQEMIMIDKEANLGKWTEIIPAVLKSFVKE